MIGGSPMKRQTTNLRKNAVIFVLVIILSPLFSLATILKAVNDTMDLYPGIPMVYNILANDTIPVNDTIMTVLLSGGHQVICQRTHGVTWVFTFTPLRWGFGGETTGSYRLTTMSGDTSSAVILFRIHDRSYGYLDINNVNARFSASGAHFFYENAEYEVPKGSGKTSIFSNTSWIGGKDAQGNLHFAGERYRQGPAGGNGGTHPDFYAGPVMDSAKYSVYQDTVWNYVWNLKKTDINYHREHFWDQGYQPINDILTWPGNGNTALGQAQSSR